MHGHQARASAAALPALPPLLTWDDFDKRRDRLLNLRPATWAELQQLAADGRD